MSKKLLDCPRCGHDDIRYATSSRGEAVEHRHAGTDGTGFRIDLVARGRYCVKCGLQFCKWCRDEHKETTR